MYTVHVHIHTVTLSCVHTVYMYKKKTACSLTHYMHFLSLTIGFDVVAEFAKNFSTRFLSPAVDAIMHNTQLITMDMGHTHL